MSVALRGFQKELKADIESAWSNGAVNVMPALATGGGKTVIMSSIIHEESGSSIAIAHRQELVSQISIALARNGVRHRIVGNNASLRRIITALQIAELGYSYIDPTARVGVAGVDTLANIENDPWFLQVRLAIQDEGHHVLKDNKWGRAQKKFPNARGLFPTATPRRADGRGLGRHADGLTDVIVEGPPMRQLIDMGYLTDYRIICPPIPRDFDIAAVGLSETTGDLNKDQLRKARHASSTLTGNVVDHYLKYASGKLGLTFEVDVQSAIETASAYRAAGVTAEVVSANTPDALRHHIINRFKRRELLQLVNVDLFGEGFDLPAIEVVSFARPTQSFAYYSQQFGRVLRLMLAENHVRTWDTFSVSQRLNIIAGSNKPRAIVLDHVGNVIRHGGPPDKHQVWTLDRRERRKKSDPDTVPLTVCLECLQPYERTKKRCPYCDHYAAPAQRGAPDFVDGDLTELDADTLKALRGNIARKDGDFYAPVGLSIPAQVNARSGWMRRQEHQRSLRNAIAWWAGIEEARGYGESESYRRFFFRYGIDVANAQLLGTQESEELAVRILNDLSKFGIDGTVNAEVYFGI
jgi:DNA repair protein RadD